MSDLFSEKSILSADSSD